MAENEQMVSNAEPDSNINPYSYLERPEFTSEKFKLEIRNLPRNFGFKDIHSLVSTCGLVAHKVKKVTDLFYVTFASEADRDAAIEQLHKRNVRGQTIRVKQGRPAADPYLSRQKKLQERRDRGESNREEDDETSGTGPKQPRLDEPAAKVYTTEEMKSRLLDSVTPLYKLPYEEQLQTKHFALRGAFEQFCKELLKVNPAAQEWIRSSQEKHGICCDLRPVTPSPGTVGYRNKCEFTVGSDLNGVRKTVGFRLASYKSGSLTVASPDCPIVSNIMQETVQRFQTLIRESPLEQYDVVTHTGYWRGLTLRTGGDPAGKSCELMIIIHFSCQQLTEAEIDTEKTRICDALVAGEPRTASVYWATVKTTNSCSSSAIDALQLLFGQPKITEHLLQCKFKLSPTAFFQVNTRATELLYSVISEWTGTCAQSTVMDVCCGTGTIGIILARHVRRVIGIELCEDAVTDARENASANDLDNIMFHCGKAEECLPMLAESLAKVENVSAVVDPPRNGLHKIVIQSLRKCSFLTRLVYVSCNARQAIGNWIDLCRAQSKRFNGPPFRLVAAQPVDLFPHTNHCEIVCLFVREAVTSLPKEVNNGGEKTTVSPKSEVALTAENPESIITETPIIQFADAATTSKESTDS